MKTKFVLLVLAALACPSVGQDKESHQGHNHAETPSQKTSLTSLEQLQVAVQKICPVSGQKLGAMGEPIKVRVGQQTAFLCCKGCQGKKLSAKHWAKIQTNLAAAQMTCPIMGKPVTASMKSTVVNGQQVFVCCPPCIAKIQADVAGSLKKVNTSYVSFVKAEKQANSDKLHIAAQGICPVSGAKLGSMGAPIKVKVGEKEHAFLCCKGCVGKKLSAENWKKIQTNLANAQGVCPVMEEKVDATMKSTVVNGRRVFVCCPPCIAKIEAKPGQFIDKVNSQIVRNIAKNTSNNSSAK